MGYNYGCESDDFRVKCLESIILLHFKKLDYLPDRDAAPLAGAVVFVTGNVIQLQPSCLMTKLRFIILAPGLASHRRSRLNSNDEFHSNPPKTP